MELADVDNEVPNLASEVRTFANRLCNCQTGSHRRILDVGDTPVALV